MTKTQPQPEYIQDLIGQAYAATPAAEPARLRQIERTIQAQLVTTTCQTPRRSTAWWVIGLSLIATGAAAWWSLQQLIPDELPIETEEFILQDMADPTPVTEGQTDTIVVKIPAEAQDTEASLEPTEAETVAKTPTDDQPTHPKRTNVIFQREVF